MKSAFRAVLPKLISSASVLAALYVAASPRFFPALYSKRVFRPLPYPDGDWNCDQLGGVKCEDVYFPARDGSLLHGWFFKQTASPYAIIFAHGNSGNITSRRKLGELILRTGASLLLFDYRGYGRSEGKPTLTGIIEDAESAMDYVIRERGFTPKEIVMYGESLGGSVASEVATQRACAGVILQSGFTSLPQIGGVHVPITRIFPRFLFPRPHLDNVELMSRCKQPLLIIHGHKDQVVPFRHACEIFEQAAEPKMFVELPDCAHSDIWSVAPQTYVDSIKTFLGSLSSHH